MVFASKVGCLAVTLEQSATKCISRLQGQEVDLDCLFCEQNIGNLHPAGERLTHLPGGGHHEYPDMHSVIVEAGPDQPLRARGWALRYTFISCSFSTSV